VSGLADWTRHAVLPAGGEPPENLGGSARSAAVEGDVIALVGVNDLGGQHVDAWFTR